MLGGYNPNYSASNSLDFGAVDIWNTSSRQGLPFGIQGAILDQHFFQRGRMGRLLNAITLQDVPHIGIGIDASTGAHIVDGVRVENVFGLYTVAILDAETYHAANAIQYHGKTNTISRHVLVHLFAGDSPMISQPANTHWERQNQF
jgi:cyanophycinase-like exopeptidase